MVCQKTNTQNSTCAKCSSKGSDGLKKLATVEASLKFKILTLTWKALNDMGPAYIKNILNVKMGRTGLRSGEQYSGMT